MNKESLEKKIAEYRAQEENLVLNVHRVQGARIVLEQVFTELEESPECACGGACGCAPSEDERKS